MPRNHPILEIYVRGALGALQGYRGDVLQRCDACVGEQSQLPLYASRLVGSQGSISSTPEKPLAREIWRVSSFIGHSASQTLANSELACGGDLQ